MTTAHSPRPVSRIRRNWDLILVALVIMTPALGLMSAVELLALR